MEPGKIHGKGLSIVRLYYAYYKIYRVSLLLRKMTNHLWNQYRFLRLLK